MSMWIVYNPDTANIFGKFYSREKAVASFICTHVNRPRITTCPVYEKVDMQHYDEWYTMVLLKSNKFTS